VRAVVWNFEQCSLWSLETLRVVEKLCPALERNFLQIGPKDYEGVAIDRNLTKNDNFGSSALWLSTSG
jgi:hypothetical protein